MLKDAKLSKAKEKQLRDKELLLLGQQLQQLPGVTLCVVEKAVDQPVRLPCCNLVRSALCICACAPA